jgi:hypothetical protein
MVEIEIGVLRGQCLARRIGERETLVAEVDAWQRQRNEAGVRVQWKFTTQDARKNSAAPIRKPPTRHNLCAEVLAALPFDGARCRLIRRTRRGCGLLCSCF